jgi:hypothetical protein
VDASPDTPGTIRVMRWVGKDQLIIGGEMNLNGTTTYIAMFDAKAAKFIALDANIKTILGPVTGIALDSDSSNSFFISGTTARDRSPYLMKLKDKQFVVLGMLFCYPSTFELYLTNFQMINLEIPPRFTASKFCL